MTNKTENSTNMAFKKITNSTTALKEISCNLNLFIMFVGILANVISLYVFLQRRLRKRKFNWYLLLLTTFELIFCSFLFLDYLFIKIFKQSVLIYEHSKLVLDFTIHTIDSFIAILTLLSSVDRLYAIGNPMKIKFFATYSKAQFVIFVSITTLFLLKLSSFIFCEIHFSANTVWYCSLISPFIFNIFPLLIICVLNSLLVFKIKKYHQCNFKANIDLLVKRSITIFVSSFQSIRCQSSATSQLNQSFNNKKKLTKSEKSHYFVILVSGMWIILTSIVYYTFNSYFSFIDLGMFSNLFNLKTAMIIQTISSVVFNFNHSINFFIYYCFHEEFKNVLVNIFRRKTALKGTKSTTRRKLNSVL